MWNYFLAGTLVYDRWGEVRLARPHTWPQFVGECEGVCRYVCRCLKVCLTVCLRLFTDTVEQRYASTGADRREERQGMLSGCNG